jgi:hypothetical protein
MMNDFRSFLSLSSGLTNDEAPIKGTEWEAPIICVLNKERKKEVLSYICVTPVLDQENKE